MESQTLAEIGSKLRTARESVGLELDDVAVKIKVSTKVLQAIEEAVPELLPQPIYVKSIIKAYGQTLGLNQGTVAEMIEQVFPARSLDNINPELTAGAREQSIVINSGSSKLRSSLVFVVLLALVGMGLWFAYDKFGEQIFSSNTNTPAIETASTAANADSEQEQAGTDANRQQRDAAYTNAVSRPFSISSSADASSSSTTAPVEMERLEPATPAQSQETAPTQEAELETARQQAVADAISKNSSISSYSTTAYNAPLENGFTRFIVLAAKGDCWVASTVDGGKPAEWTLRKGSHYVADFKTSLQVRFGNPGALQGFYAGEPFEIKPSRTSSTYNFPADAAN